MSKQNLRAKNEAMINTVISHQKSVYTQNRPASVIAICLGIALFSLSACSDFNKAIGKQKSSPDEFEVVVRPPLSLPPGFAARPSTETVSQTAASAPTASAQASALLRSRDGSAQGYEKVFNFGAIEEDVRTRVDEETAGIQIERRLPLQIIFGGVPQVGPVLNQMEEDARLRRNRLLEKPLTDGSSPAIDGVLGDPVAIE